MREGDHGAAVPWYPPHLAAYISCHTAGFTAVGSPVFQARRASVRQAYPADVSRGLRWAGLLLRRGGASRGLAPTAPLRSSV
jgi:hypothetical protein